ncbi:MAG TPA: TolC family outer membrane protein [Rhodanobacteraceae bacterium]|nr:TolC family outer membrane protein [Rhodanobacteraceae bacterium]
MRTRSLPLALAALLAAGTTVAHAEDLLQIYKEARASDPQLAGAEATRYATEEGVDQARSQLLPQISAGLDYRKSHGSGTNQQFVNDPDGNLVLLPITSSSHSYGRTLNGTLTQSILDISRWTALKSSRAQAEAGDATYEAAQQDLYVRVATAYFDVLTAEDALKFAQSNEKALNRQLEQAQQRFEVGLSAITDVNDAKANHDSAVANVIAAQNAVDDTREALRQLTNKPPGELKTLRDDLPLDHPKPDDPAAWVDVALKENPTLSSFAFQTDAAAANVDTARAGHLPTITGQVVYTRSPNWADQNSVQYGGELHTNSESSDTAIGFSLNVPLFTGGLTRSRVRQAIYNRDFAQDQYELQRRLVVRDTRSNYRAVIAGASEVDARKQAVVSAQSSLDATQAGYEVGTRTIVDVLISQQQLLQAQSDYSQARHSFVLNGLKLKQSAGVIELRDLELVNALLE